MSQVKLFNPPQQLKIPVLLIVFNRLDTTLIVFEEIKKAQPPKLYIASDGPRKDKLGEESIVIEIRKYLINNINWDCQVFHLFRDENLGCKLGVSSAISWFFKKEKMGIILEDDCVPSQSFFWYCEELLIKYAEDDSIYAISGDSRATDEIPMKGSYNFCKYPMIWGWASWARVWEKYDVNISNWPNEKSDFLKKTSRFSSTRRFWKKTFNLTYKSEIDTWDYQFCYLLLRNKAKCIIPSHNLITNIGFGANATHTLNTADKSANRNRVEISLPLNHEVDKQVEKIINDFCDQNEFQYPSIFKRAWIKIRSTLLRK